MTTSIDVCNAIADVVAKLWPERMIYRDFCEDEFKRPSSFLYVIKSTMEPANVSLVEWTMEAELELFCATNKYDISSTEALRKDQEAVLLAFAPPSLQVGDRHITLTAIGDGTELGSAYVKFTATWFDQRPGYHDPEETAPVMEHFEVNGHQFPPGNTGKS